MTAPPTLEQVAAAKAEMDKLCALAIAHDRTHNDGGYGYNPYREDADEAVRAYTLALRDAEWTPEATAERRAAWNAFVKTLPIVAGKVDFRLVAAQQTKQGWTQGDLKDAIARHGL